MLKNTISKIKPQKKGKTNAKNISNRFRKRKALENFKNLALLGLGGTML